MLENEMIYHLRIGDLFRKNNITVESTEQLQRQHTPGCTLSIHNRKHRTVTETTHPRIYLEHPLPLNIKRNRM